MFKGFDEWLDNNRLAVGILEGVCISLGIMFLLLAVATLIAAFMHSLWLILVSIGCVILTGAAFGFSSYLFYEY
jgi:hypothetical protein